MRRMKRAVAGFLADEQGQDIVEYTLLLVLIGGVAIFILTGMGVSISQIFNKINQRLDSANRAISWKAVRNTGGAS